MKHSIKTGLSFGLTSGVITTIGLMVGLNSGTHSKIVVIGGVLTIAIADAFSDALGIHISEESENKHTFTEIWEATLSTFLSKFIFASTFIIPVIILPLSISIIVSILWGLTLITIFSFYIAKGQRTKHWKIIIEHLIIAIIVIIITYYVGNWIGTTFNSL
ncbi:MAG: hypothetical protein DRN12_03340 [Thermoplasmata archaeon]|nr:MAG: hypothetical protein DRN12_03340 [Thermoplasmata archaeon]